MKRRNPEKGKDQGKTNLDPQTVTETEGPASEDRLDSEMLARSASRSENLAELRQFFCRFMRNLWPEADFFFVLLDRAGRRFLALLEDGRLVPKPAASFALEDFLTSPGRAHTYTEQINNDPELLGRFSDLAVPDGITIHSLAVPIRRKGFLRGAVGIFSNKPFGWDKKDVGRLAEIGRIFLDVFESLNPNETLDTPLEAGEGASPEIVLRTEAHELRERLEIHEALFRIIAGFHPPLDVPAIVCRKLAPFFTAYNFTIAVHFPESRLFVIHSPEGEPRRVACSGTLEGYFLYRSGEDVLAIEDFRLWSPPPPLRISRDDETKPYKSGLFAAGRIHGNLVAVAGLRSTTPVAWEAREVETLRDVALGLAIAYYQATVADDLTYTSREAHRRLQEAREEGRELRRRVEDLQIAFDIASKLADSRSLAELLDRLRQILADRWPDAKITFQRYIREKNAFSTIRIAAAEPSIRPARFCVQNLFLNNVPVSHIVCDSPQEIAYYRNLDPELVKECEEEGFGSFCTAPIFIGGRLWGTITIQTRKPSVCSPHAELISLIGRAVALPILAAEMREAKPAD